MASTNDQAPDHASDPGPEREDGDQHDGLELLRGTPNQARTGARARRIAAAVRDWSEDVHRPFVVALNRFQESLIALRQLHEAIDPLLTDLEETHVDEEVRAALVGLTEEQVTAVAEFVDDTVPGLINGAVYFYVRPGGRPSERTKNQGDKEPSSAPPWEAITEILGDRADVALDVLSIAYRANLGPSRAYLLRGSLMTSAIAAFEALLVDFATQYYLLNPGAMGDEPEFSLKKLKQFDSLEDAEFDAAVRRAEDVTQGDLQDWAKWLAKHPKVKLETHCIDFDSLFEILQRRHIQVHNGGFVSRRYREKMISAVGDSADLGRFLDIDEIYLNNAFDQIETVGNLIAANVWTKCMPDQEPAAMFALYQRSYDLLLLGRWSAVVKICSMAQGGDSEQSLKMIHRVNELLARKRMGEDIEAQLNEWDVSALGPRFRLAKLCLADDLDGVAVAIPKMLDKQDLGWPEVVEWPILKEYRTDNRFRELAAERDLPIGSSSQPDQQGD